MLAKPVPLLKLYPLAVTVIPLPTLAEEKFTDVGLLTVKVCPPKAVTVPTLESVAEVLPSYTLLLAATPESVNVYGVIVPYPDTFIVGRL